MDLVIKMQRTRNLGNIINWAFHKPGIETDVKNLRDSNEKFARLVRDTANVLQTSEENQISTIHRKTRHKAKGPLRGFSLKSYSRARSASIDLHETISTRWICSLHAKHRVNIGQSVQGDSMTVLHQPEFILGFQSLDEPDNQETMFLKVAHTGQEENAEKDTVEATDNIRTSDIESYGLYSEVKNLVKLSSQKTISSWNDRSRKTQSK